MAIKSHFLRWAAPLAARLSPGWVSRLNQMGVIMPFYHLVADQPGPHIRHLYPVKSVAAFRRDIDYYLKYYTPISVAELLALAQQGKKPARPSVLISFDDGLREVYDVAAPILQERGLSAIVFVNSAFVDNRALFYRYQAGLLCNRIAAGCAPDERSKVAAWAKKYELPDRLSPAQWPLQIGYTQRGALPELAAILNLDFDNFLLRDRPYMTTAQLQELAQTGFYIGAHSVDHPLYAAIDADEQWRQSIESLAYVNHHFQPSQKLFSFPFTDHGVARGLQRRLLESGAADMVFGCAGLKPGLVAGHWQRIPIELAGMDAPAIVQGETLYAFFRDFLLRSKTR